MFVAVPPIVPSTRSRRVCSGGRLKRQPPETGGTRPLAISKLHFIRVLRRICGTWEISESVTPGL